LGTFVTGVDPWVREELFNNNREGSEGGGREVLLPAARRDHFDSRSQPAAISEASMYLSRAQDLDAIASQEQQLEFLYGPSGRGADSTSGRVLDVVVQGGQAPLEYFVYAQSDDCFNCVLVHNHVRLLAVTNVMVKLVSGVLTFTAPHSACDVTQL
jgi:hypothetical protein